MMQSSSYLYATRTWTLKFTHKGEGWEDLWVAVFADAGGCVSGQDVYGDEGKVVTGYTIVLMGANGTFLPLRWRSRRQAIPTANSGEGESIAWATAAKEAMRVAVMVMVGSLLLIPGVPMALLSTNSAGAPRQRALKIM